jgi:hypothetical protein
MESNLPAPKPISSRRRGGLFIAIPLGLLLAILVFRVFVVLIHSALAPAAGTPPSGVAFDAFNTVATVLDLLLVVDLVAAFLLVPVGIELLVTKPNGRTVKGTVVLAYRGFRLLARVIDLLIFFAPIWVV